MDKILLVIGASSDIGTATIRSISDDYSFVIAHYRNMNDKLSALEEELQDKLILLQADLGKESDVRDFIKKIENINKIPTHILHLPAPQCNNSRFHKIEWEVFQNEIDISLRSIVLVLQSLLPKMTKNKFGRIVIMLSYVVNNTAPAYCCNYVVTKYALLGFMKALATEYADKGITVNGISPSWINTRYIDNQPEMLKLQNAEASPLGRNLEVEDIIPGIKYLLSDGAFCVNGENITISCGR